MKADGQFVGNIGSVFQPIPRIAKQGGESLANFMMRDADVLFCGSIGSGPLPSLIEHSQMEIPSVGLDKRVTSAKIFRCECPRIRFENILSFPLVQFFPGREVGNEISLFIGRQRRVSLSLREETHGMPRFLRRRLVSASTASSTRPTA